MTKDGPQQGGNASLFARAGRTVEEEVGETAGVGGEGFEAGGEGAVVG